MSEVLKGDDEVQMYQNMDLEYLDLIIWFDRRQQGWVKSISSQHKHACSSYNVALKNFIFIITVITIKAIQSGKYCAGLGAKNTGGRNTRPTIPFFPSTVHPNFVTTKNRSSYVCYINQLCLPFSLQQSTVHPNLVTKINCSSKLC